MSPSSINSARDAIIASCMSRRVTIVVGETGTGKSTFVPMWISEAASNNRIVCAQPRRVAATSIAHRVSSLLGETSVGESVGYRVRGEVVGSDSTRIVYATAGYLRTALSCDKSLLEKYTHVVLDEVHERSMDTDFLSLIVKLLLSSDPRFASIHLIVMSATIDSKVFQEYFGLLCPLGETVSIVEIPSSGNGYTIETLYLEDISDLSEIPEDQFRETASVDLTCSLAISNAIDGYTTLIFLPGEAEIMAVEKRLSHYIGQETVSCDDENFSPFDSLLRCRQSVYYQIHILHSLVPSIDQRRALKAPVGPRGRHIVLATNIAESSLTVEAVNLVIDSGLKKELVWEDSRGGITTLKTQWTSLASITQRKGRTGRVCNGKVFRLFTRETESKFSQFDVAESVLANPSRVFLSAKYISEKWNQEYNPIELIEGLIGWEKIFCWDTLFEELFAQGVISSVSKNCKLTLFGSLATWLQLDTGVAKLVYLCWLMDLPIEGIVLAAASTCEKDLFKHGSRKVDWFFHNIENSQKFRILYDMGMSSDLLMLRNLLVSYLAMRSLYSEESGKIYTVPFHANSVFPIEFQSFKNACLLIARGLQDWLGISSKVNVSGNGIVSKSLLDDIFSNLENNQYEKKIDSKIQIFKSILNDRKKCNVSYSELSSLFIPMTDYQQVDQLKLIIAISFSGRTLYANSAFPRCSGKVFSMEKTDSNLVSKICGGIEPVDIRVAKEKSVLVFAGNHPEESEALAVPNSSEYACVTTSVAIRNILCLFEKAWKVGDVKKPYVFNICRWFLPASPLDVADTRVYLNVRNPSGWLETRRNAIDEDPSGSSYKRSRLGNTFFCVPAKLVVSGSLVKAEMNTILPIRSGGRVAITMLLAAIPFRGSSVRNRLVRNEDGHECVDVLNRLVTTRSEYSINESLVEAIDKFRQLITRAIFIIEKPDEAFSADLISTMETMMELSNAEPVIQTSETLVDEVEGASRVFQIRMDAITAEIDSLWDNRKLTLTQIENTCSHIWDMYESSLLDI